MSGLEFPQLRDVAWLRREYVDGGKTTLQIAEDLGCAQATVYRALKRYGIPVRGPQRVKPKPPPEPPRFPGGFSTHKCVACHRLTRLAACPKCGGELESVVVFNALDANDYRQPLAIGSTWGLTSRESEVMALIADGLSTVDITKALGLSENTVKLHYVRGRTKMIGGTSNRVLAARMWWTAEQEAIQQALLLEEVGDEPSHSA